MCCLCRQRYCHDCLPALRPPARRRLHRFVLQMLALRANADALTGINRADTASVYSCSPIAGRSCSTRPRSHGRREWRCDIHSCAGVPILYAVGIWFGESLSGIVHRRPGAMQEFERTELVELSSETILESGDLWPPALCTRKPITCIGSTSALAPASRKSNAGAGCRASSLAACAGQSRCAVGPGDPFGIDVFVAKLRVSNPVNRF